MKTTKPQKAHYVYKITNNNPTDSRKYYIGVRTAPNGNPQEDTKYWSSSKYLKEAIEEIGLENFSKEILSTWETREEAIAEEIRLHEKLNISLNENYYNKAKQTSTGFDRTGISNEYRLNKIFVLNTNTNSKELISVDEYRNSTHYKTLTKDVVTVLDTRDGSTKYVSKDDYKNNNYYVSTTKGKINVLDTRDNKFKCISLDEFHNNDFYETSSKNKVAVIDKRDGIKKLVDKADYKRFDHYESVAKGKINVVDKRDGIKKCISKEEFYNNKKYYKTPKVKTIKIFDADNNEVFTVDESFSSFCKNNGLPYCALTHSFKNGGLPLYQTKAGISQAKKNGSIQFMGWYAKIENQ
jgi:hypothetical protein